jgi:hypothetical protein
LISTDETQKGVNIRLPSDLCLWGSYCGHGILTVRCGVYRCPFGSGQCFKRALEPKPQPQQKPLQKVASK